MDKEQAIYDAWRHKPAPKGFVRIWEDDGQDGGWWENITEAEFQEREEAREDEEKERALTHNEEGDSWFCQGFRL